MKLRKTICLVFLFIFVFLTSCTGTESNLQEQETFEDVDLYGANFIFATNWTIEYFPPEARTSEGDKMRKRYADAGDKYNCVFEPVEFTESTMSAYILSAAAVGSGVPDLCDTHAVYAYSAYLKDLLYPMEEITTIDINNEKWGPAKFRKYGIWDGLSYGFFPYDWEFIPQYGGALFFNNELIIQHGIESPYEIQERSEWNWDKFEEILKTATFTSGDIDYMGLKIVDGIPRFLKSVIMSNNGSVVKYENDKYKYNIDSPEAMQAFDYIQKLKSQKTITDQLLLADFSLNKKVTFLAGDSWYGTVNITNEDTPSMVMDDWGFITFPHGPSADSSATSSFVNINRRLNWVVGVADNDVDDFGIVLDYIFAPLDNSEPQAWKKLAEQQYFIHNKGYQNFIKMLENCNYDYSAELYDTASDIDSLFSSIYNGRSASTENERIKEKVQLLIDEILNANN